MLCFVLLFLKKESRKRQLELDSIHVGVGRVETSCSGNFLESMRVALVRIASNGGHEV